MMANLVWSMPQFALGTVAMQQNLFPSIIGVEVMPDPWGKIPAGCILLAVSITSVMVYSAGGKGAKVFEPFALPPGQARPNRPNYAAA
jgi:hypothetical protein